MSRYKLKQKWNETKEKGTKDEVISQIGIGSIPESIFSLSENKLVKPKVQYEDMPFHRFKEHLIKGKRQPICVHEGVHLLDRTVNWCGKKSQAGLLTTVLSKYLKYTKTISLLCRRNQKSYVWIFILHNILLDKLCNILFLTIYKYF